MDYDAPLSDVAAIPKQRRRHYSAAFKAQIIAESDHPDASVAGVAIRHSLNPNMVQKWRMTQRRDSQDDFLRLPSPLSPGSQTATVDEPATLRMEVPTRQTQHHFFEPVIDLGCDTVLPTGARHVRPPVRDGAGSTAQTALPLQSRDGWQWNPHPRLPLYYA